jgi:hypothetical protein
MPALTHRRLLARAIGALALCAAAASSARAQEPPTEFDAWRLPGWTITPGITVGTLFDSNVAIASAPAAARSTASDTLFQIEPFGQVDYVSPRVTFDTGYQGVVRRYVQLNDLDGTDQRAFVSLRDLVTRRVTVFFTDNFLQVPTTDQLELNDVPFQRTGSRYDAFAGGVEARLSKSNDFATRYEMTWVDFVRKDTALTGGVVNGVISSLTHRFTERAAAGAEYGVRFADLNQGTQHQVFQNAGGVYRYRTGPDTTFEVAAGLSHLQDETRAITRTGPYVHADLTRRTARATLALDFERSYVPSLAFGGTNQSQEVRGSIQMPVTRNRLYVQEAAAWRRTDPLTTTELALDSIWVQTVVGYALERWIRIEGYHSFTRQDTRLAGGQINRNVAGVQFVVAEPKRIR